MELVLIRTICLAMVAIATLAAAGPAGAQHEMHHPSGPVASPRLGSGTSWLPDSTYQPMVGTRLGTWTAMVHGNAFGLFDRQSTLHGDSRWGVLDWEMGRVSRPLAKGVFRAAIMTSFEALFLPDTGYPQLLQSGETFGRRRVANTQHPHDLIGELALGYDRTIIGELVSTVYVAAVGEPALGPVTYRHRPSAAANPFAPLGLHWQDAAHQSHGVVTAGLYTRHAHVEGSAFNGREPDSNRVGLDYRAARLDSYAVRLTLAPTGRVVAAAWMGYLADHDPLDPGVGMQRYGASLMTELAGVRGGHWSTSLVWGMNNHHHGLRGHDHESASVASHHYSSSVLVESALGVGQRTELFMRAEQVQKMADDLGFIGGNLMETFNVRALSLGAERAIVSRYGATAGIGGLATMNLLPETLRYTYTTTRPAGFAIYLRILPGTNRPM